MDDSKSGKQDPVKMNQTDGLQGARTSDDSVVQNTESGVAGDIKDEVKDGVMGENVFPVKKKRRRPRRKKKKPVISGEMTSVAPLYKVEDNGEQNISYEPYSFDDTGPNKPNTATPAMENLQNDSMANEPYLENEPVNVINEPLGDNKESVIEDNEPFGADSELFEAHNEPEAIEPEILDRKDMEPKIVPPKENDFEKVESGYMNEEVNHEEKPEAEVKDESPESDREPQSMADIKKMLNDIPNDDKNEKSGNTLVNVFLQVWPYFAKIFNFGVLLKVVIIVGVIWGVYFIFSSGVFNFQFGGKPITPETSGTPIVQIEGDLNLPADLGVYFGELKEPSEKGETGISPALYFGGLQDENEAGLNQYIEYVRNLEELYNLYSTDVYDLLDKSSKRDEVLFSYLNDLKTSRDKSLKMLSAININIDEMKTSYNSLTPEKNKFENDYFTSLRAFQAAKSDVLLKNFVDVSQKQTALKARVFALETLAEYYDAALYNLGRRILSVEKNKDALIKGVRVTDVPGAGIDLIIKSE